MTEINIGQDKEAIYTAKATEMWGRASMIVINRSNKREVVLAVMKGHLAEYRSIPAAFLERAVAEGILSAGKVEAEILEKDPKAKPGYVAMADSVRDFLIEANIYKPSPGGRL